MEAKDTVMSPQEISKVRRQWASGQIVGGSPENDLIKAQAEISFKVGKTAGVAESLISSLKAIGASRKAGIKEVMDWIKGNHVLGVGDDGLYWQCYISEQEWEAKLKEWGL